MNHGVSPPPTLAEVERNNVDKYSEAKQPPRSGIWRRRDEQMLKKRTEWWREVLQSRRNPEERGNSCGGGSLRYRKNVKLSLHWNFYWLTPVWRKTGKLTEYGEGRRQIGHFTVASQHCLWGGGYLDYQIVNVLSAAHPVSCSILGHDVVIVLVVLWLL